MNRRTFLKYTGAAGIASLAGDWMFTAHAATHGPLRFAAINDLHVKGAGTERIVARAAEAINALDNIAFTVAVGDLGTDGAEDEMALAKQALDTLSMPYWCVPGNHDFAPKIDNGFAHYDANFTRRAWRESVEPGAWAFLGLNTCNKTSSNVTVPEERLDALSEQLDEIPAETPVALFGHHPFNPNTKAYRVKNAEEVLERFTNHNLRLVVSGHYHGNQVETRDNVTFITSNCCATTRGNFDGTEERGFRVFEVTGEDLRHEFKVVPHEDLMPQKG
jgi:3',5'-cyclic AMP phosphodiesterase CpdA